MDLALLFLPGAGSRGDGGRRRPGLFDEGGQVSLPLLAVVVVCVAVAAAVAVGSTLHSARAAHTARAVACAQLAAGAAEWALAQIPALPATWSYSGAGPEPGTAVDVAWSPAAGSYTIATRACTGTPEERQVAAEVLPPPAPYNFLARDVTVAADAAAGLAHTVRMAGDVNALASARLSLTGLVGAASTLQVQGTVHALSATLECQPVGSTVDGGTVAAGSVTENERQVLGVPVCTVQHQQAAPPASPLFRYHGADPGYFEALVAERERAGQLPALTAAEAQALGCAFSGSARVTGDLDCGSATMKVPAGALVAVDGAVTAQQAEIGGVLYARGAAVPDATGHVTVGGLQLAQVATPAGPLQGGGTVAATGNVNVSSATLAALLPAGAPAGAVLQVLALQAGAGDASNDIALRLQRVLDLLGGAAPPPLFLYAAEGGSVTLTFADTLSLATGSTLPATLLAGKEVQVNVGGALQALSAFTLEPLPPDQWPQVPPSLQDLGRVQVKSWRTD